MGGEVSHWEASGQSDEWWTPPHVFAALGVTFDMDVAAPIAKTHVPAERFITRSSPKTPWQDFIWMNAPFGGRNQIAVWLDKFFEHGNGIALTPDRTSAPWFHDAWRKADAVLFTRKIRFLRPDGSEGKSPSCGTCLWAAGDKGETALICAALNGLGILGRPLPLPLTPPTQEPTHDR